jgi:hypothetical protein
VPDAARDEHERAGYRPVRRVVEDELHGAFQDEPGLVIAPVHAVIRGAARPDPEFEHLYQRLQAERFAAHRRLIEPMIGRPATDDEAETFSALTSPELHHLLTVTRGWTQQRYAEWLEQTVTSLLSADAWPPRTPRPPAAR